MTFLSSLTTTPTKTLAPALFDELKKRADAGGGIGYDSDNSTPRCIGDFARAIDRDNGTSAWSNDETYSSSVGALVAALGTHFGELNDAAVSEINERKGNVAFFGSSLPRVSFDELVAELGLVRGEA